MKVFGQVFNPVRWIQKTANEISTVFAKKLKGTGNRSTQPKPKTPPLKPGRPVTDRKLLERALIEREKQEVNLLAALKEKTAPKPKPRTLLAPTPKPRASLAPTPTPRTSLTPKPMATQHVQTPESKGKKTPVAPKLTAEKIAQFDKKTA